MVENRKLAIGLGVALAAGAIFMVTRSASAGPPPDEGDENIQIVIYDERGNPVPQV